MALKKRWRRAAEAESGASGCGSNTGMHGTGHRVQKRWTFCLPVPRPLFSPTAGSIPANTPQPLLFSSKRSRVLVTAFRSPAANPPFGVPVDGINVPGLLLRPFASRLLCPFGPVLHYQFRFAPVPAASSPMARCSSTAQHRDCASHPPLPSGTFTSLGIDANCRVHYRSARLPDTLDLLSLPPALSISRFGLRIIVPGPLRFRSRSGRAPSQGFRLVRGQPT